MTSRMVAALENPFLDILGHCTGRLLPRSEQPTAKPEETAGAGAVDAAKVERGGRGGERGRRRGGGRGRPESTFDAGAVFAAAVAHDKAIEINSRPERLDPPKRLLRQALEAGCRFSVDTDAHAPGQLDWQRYGCERAVACGVTADRIVNTWTLDDLLAWARGHQGG
jgi:putative hydrolase